VKSILLISWNKEVPCFTQLKMKIKNQLNCFLRITPYASEYMAYLYNCIIMRSQSASLFILVFLSARAKPERFYILLKLSIFLHFNILVSFFSQFVSFNLLILSFLPPYLSFFLLLVSF